MWKNLFKELKRKDHQRYLGDLNISVPDCWLLWGLSTRGTGPLILLRVPIMVMHCCG